MTVSVYDVFKIDGLQFMTFTLYHVKTVCNRRFPFMMVSFMSFSKYMFGFPVYHVENVCYRWSENIINGKTS